VEPLARQLADVELVRVLEVLDAEEDEGAEDRERQQPERQLPLSDLDRPSRRPPPVKLLVMRTRVLPHPHPDVQRPRAVVERLVIEVPVDRVAEEQAANSSTSVPRNSHMPRRAA
jgi:hypothetical protein